MTDNWNDAATSALEAIWDLVEEETHFVSVDSLRDDLDMFIKGHFNEVEGQKAAISAWWGIIGSSAVMISEGRGVHLTVDSVQETLVRKQRDYGHENIRRFGLQGLMVRIHDKVARLENLLSTGGTPNNESIDDTLLDIVGYSAIGIMWERDEFLLDLTPI